MHELRKIDSLKVSLHIDCQFGKGEEDLPFNFKTPMQETTRTSDLNTFYV